MKIGVIADDFTGASDIALTLSNGGMRTVQYVGVPDESAHEDVSAGVISLKSRTIPARDAIEQSLAACEYLLGQGAQQIVFKVCSTFDSTDKGNIGPVSDALADRLGEEKVLVCPAFPEAGRSVYNGHLFVADRLLNESGMQNHPLTPMTDPDIRRVLARQSKHQVGHIPATSVNKGRRAIEVAVGEADERFLIVDAIYDDDLLNIGAAAKHRKLLVGGSGIALGLPANFTDKAQPAEWNGSDKEAVVLSGSCSIATRAQVRAYREIAPSYELLADDVMANEVNLDELADWVFKQDKTPIVYSSADPEIVKEAQDKFGRELVAEKIEYLFAKLAATLAKRGVGRFVVAGGETSGAVTKGLNAIAMEVGPAIAAGVPCLKLVDRDIVLALKSGNFGRESFFEDALSILGTGR